MNTPTSNNPPNAPDPLAIALAKLDPVPHGFDWNALMFAAGRASKARALLFWRIVAGIGVVAACGFALAFFLRPPVVVERQHVIHVDRMVPDAVPPAPLPLPLREVKSRPPAPATGWSSDPPRLNTRNEMLTVGLGVLPDAGPKVAPPSRGER